MTALEIKLLIYGFLLAGLAGYVGWQHHEATHWHDMYDAGQATVTHQQAQLADQNKSIDDWKKQADARSAEAKQAMAALDKIAALANSRAGALINLQLPQDECNALRLLIDRDRADSLRDAIADSKNDNAGALPGLPASAAGALRPR